MSILDKLIEKKDLNAYITFRIENLRKQRETILAITSDKEKQSLIERFKGRITELEMLQIVIQQNKLKYRSKSYWRKTQ